MNATLVRVGLALIATALIVTLVATSTAVAVLPEAPEALGLIGGWIGVVIFTGILILALPVATGLLGTRTLLAASTFAASVHLYAYSRLDWFRLLKEFCSPDGTVCLTTTDAPTVGTIVFAASPLIIALVFHVTEQARLVHETARAKGAPGDEPPVAAQAVWRPAVLALSVAIGLTLATSLAYALATALSPYLSEAWIGVPFPLLFPLAAGLLVLAAAWPALAPSE